MQGDFSDRPARGARRFRAGEAKTDAPLFLILILIIIRLCPSHNPGCELKPSGNQSPIGMYDQDYD